MMVMMKGDVGLGYAASMYRWVVEREREMIDKVEKIDRMMM